MLFRIDPRPFEARPEAGRGAGRCATSRAATRRPRRRRRYQELLDKNFVSKDAYAQYRTNAQTAEATSKASQAALENAKLNLEYTVIRSPIDGYVGRALLQAGNMVKANDTISLVVINQVKPVYVSFAIPEQQLADVRDLMRKSPLTVEVAAPGSDKAIADRAASRSSTTRSTRPPARSRCARSSTTRDAALWPGQFYTVRVKLYDQENAILVPSRALQTGPDGQFVYVVKPDMTVEVRKVVVDAHRGRHRRARRAATVAKGDQVVVRGALRLAPGAKVTDRRERAAVVNLSEIFVRRPVMTILVMTGILIFGVVAFRLLPVSQLPNVDYPTIQVTAELPGAAPGHDGLGGGDGAGEAVLHHRRHRLDDLGQRPGHDLDHHPVQPRPRHRRRRAGRQFGDRRHRAPAAAGDADAAVVPQGEPGRLPGVLPRAHLGRAADLDRERVRRDLSRAAHLHHQRRGAGAGVRPAEIRGARAGRPERARGARRRA